MLVIININIWLINTRSLKIIKYNQLSDEALSSSYVKPHHISPYICTVHNHVNHFGYPLRCMFAMVLDLTWN